MSETIFSKIIRREAPAKIVHEDELTMAFHDINPKAPIHILIVPKKPIPTLADVSEEDLPLISHIHKVAQTLAKAYECEGWRLVVNVGEKGGQEVFHLHYHFLGWPKE
ncbi:histidine triad (HIT) protein [Caldalkalibacillus thermarum TA2.A1]|uniref:Histidine triad (HIT) protein n=1 Tax=Caldalkalibacillus thermarum (strain TA2.A1) TaxID=986075 RepID=F5L7M0_CALTT|nr:histidine triad nucleotide-binding protein [Caldalkalibacillus thermarum]EGL82664.1 histidine triad (HIT) protein [Caldalkalibacillus thermarum TA2.A1]QZT33382.1 histidine triad nucleotide-binding protein [Caldalkalibacillus thermarum TA2.A1]